MIFDYKIVCVKISVTIIEDNFFKDLSTNRKKLYWSIINCLVPFLMIVARLSTFHISGYIEVDKIFVKII